MNNQTILLICMVLITACAAPVAPTPAALPVPTAPLFTQLEALPAQGQITTLGYLLITPAGAILTPAAGFSAATPAALGPITNQIWCGSGTDLSITGALATTSEVRHAIVLAAGTLDPPGSYGPAGAFPRQLRNLQITVVNPQEASIGALRENMGFYNQRVVRVVGWILLSSGSAVLVDTVGQGGVPQPGAISLKLRRVIEDSELVAGLQATSSGTVRYGQVQVEGYIQAGALVPIAMRAVGR